MKTSKLLALMLMLGLATVTANAQTLTRSVVIQPAGSATTTTLNLNANPAASWALSIGDGGGITTGPFLKLNTTAAGNKIVQYGLVSLTAGSTDITGTLGVANGGTGNTTVGAAGTVAFSDGTKLNYTAAGTTGQILVSGGAGTPTWTSTLPAGTSVPFNLITSGTNTQAAMLVGAGASLAPTSTGTITANQFVGTGSTTNAVDLATAEVNGTLPVGNGGTGVTSVSAGSLLVGNGSSPMTTLGPGANGTVLQIVAGVPTWSTTNTLLASLSGTYTVLAADQTAGNATITPAASTGYNASSRVIVTYQSVSGGAAQAVTLGAQTATTFVVYSGAMTTGDKINYIIVN